ncbi:protein of unknown function [Shewanella benthica]|uniref:Uncharacterized protein n=1 Tax=Shewanella benthica TaxID=43661 RepID=A0A330MA58_9GAMM|nr:protein of unknown function [Shewanella benthica]
MIPVTCDGDFFMLTPAPMIIRSSLNFEEVERNEPVSRPA